MKFLIRFILSIIIAFSGISTVHAVPVIEPGDTLQIYIVDQSGADLLAGTFSQPSGELSRNTHELRVSNMGRIYIPFVGTLKVANKTEEQLENELRRLVGAQMKLRELSVLLVSPKFDRIFVTGEVRNPGMIMTDIARSEERRLLNVLAKAGGLSELADRSQITILSKSGVRKTINMLEMVKTLSVSQNAELADGDTVFVPQAIGRVFVIGEVTLPTGYPYIEGASIADYVAMAGGLRDTADGGNLGLFTRDSSGNPQLTTGIRNDYSTGVNTTAKIKAGDIIFVPRHFFANWRDLGSVLGITRDALYIQDLLKKP